MQSAATRCKRLRLAVSPVVQFLKSLKLPLYPDPVWDGCFASVVDKLAVLAADKGVKALRKGQVGHVCALVAQPEEAQGVLRILLALPVLRDAKKGATSEAAC